MKQQYVIDLSHRIVEGKEHFKFKKHIDDVTKILPEVIHRPDIWYVLGEVTMCTHVGTHMEVPYHHWEVGTDTADFPIHKLVAPGVVLDFRHKKAGEAIHVEELEPHAERICEGDIVFINQGMGDLYWEENWDDQAHLSIEANRWLIDKKIAALGTDASGVEVPGTDHQPNHVAVSEAGIPMMESLKNLDLLGEERHLIIALPLPFDGLDASPLRVLAIKKEGLEDMLCQL